MSLRISSFAVITPFLGIRREATTSALSARGENPKATIGAQPTDWLECGSAQKTAKPWSSQNSEDHSDDSDLVLKLVMFLLTARPVMRSCGCNNDEIANLNSPNMK